MKPSDLYGLPKVVPQTSLMGKLSRAPSTPHSQTHSFTSRSSAKPMLQQLQWLPIKDCINYNLARLAHKVQTFTCLPTIAATSQRPISEIARRVVSFTKFDIGHARSRCHQPCETLCQVQRGCQIVLPPSNACSINAFFLSVLLFFCLNFSSLG